MSRWLLIWPLLLLTGCASVPIAPPVSGDAVVPPPAEQVDLWTQLANNDLAKAATADADKTLAWVDAEVAAQRLSPLKAAMAKVCPTMVKMAAADFKDKVLALKAALDNLKTQGQDMDLSKPQVIYVLTRLKYGQGFNPQQKIAELKDDVITRLDALLTGCLGLLPVKQANQVLKLAVKLGLVSQVPVLAALPELSLLAP